MTNREMFDTFVSFDLRRVQEYLKKEYTETSEWKIRLEALHSSLEALLKDMDLKDKEGINE